MYFRVSVLSLTIEDPDYLLGHTDLRVEAALDGVLRTGDPDSPRVPDRILPNKRRSPLPFDDSPKSLVTVLV